MALLKSIFGGGDRSADGAPGRAVVRHGHCGLSPGERGGSVRTKLEVVLPDGSSAKLIESLPWKLAVALCGWNQSDAPDWYDTDIAVRVDPTDGRVIALDRPVIERELAWRFPLIDQSWSMRGQVSRTVTDVTDNVRSAAGLPGAIADAARSVADDLTTPVDDALVVPEHLELSDGDPSLTPIEGVTYDAWVDVQGGMLREKVRPKDRFAFAEAHGIPAGRWDAISSEWTARAQRDRGLAIRLAHDLQSRPNR